MCISDLQHSFSNTSVKRENRSVRCFCKGRCRFRYIRMSSPSLNNIIFGWLCVCLHQYLTDGYQLIAVSGEILHGLTDEHYLSGLFADRTVFEKDKERFCLDSHVDSMYQFHIGIWIDVRQNVACPFDLYQYKHYQKG